MHRTHQILKELVSQNMRNDSFLCVPTHHRPPCGTASPGRLDPNQHEDLESDSPVQVPFLDGAGHDQAAKEEEVGVEEVLGADLAGG